MKTYLKSPPADPKKAYRYERWSWFWHRLKSLLPTIMIVVGATLVISVIYPIVNYELSVGLRARREKILSPLANPKDFKNSQVSAQAVGSGDYRQVSRWFDFSRPQTFLSPSNITHYTLTVPKLRIKNALVTIGGDDLSTSLIQYGGTVNPGEAGNTVIFGHSILPQFYNPDSYRAIFSLLPTLNVGEEILVNFDGIVYKYIVYDYLEVAPAEIDILEQQYAKKELTLVTCVPPGTYLRRGIIKARLVEI